MNSEICRLCLSKNKNLLEIFSDLLNESGKLKNTLMQLLDLQISELDPLPCKKICIECLVQIESWKIFKENCLKNNDKLKKMYGILEEEEIEEPEYVMLDPNKMYESDEDESENQNQNQQQQEPNEIEVEEVPVQQSNVIDTPAPLPPAPIPLPVQAPQSQSKQANFYLCKYCDICFLEKGDCETHENQDHDKNYPYKCNFCQFASDSKNTIIFHIKEIHNVDKPWICVQCNKSYVKRSDLKKHTFLHIGIKPYTCTLCMKSFSRNANLNKHKRIHMGLSKNFMCTHEGCTKGFNNKFDLYRHFEAHTRRHTNTIDFPIMQTIPQNQMPEQLPLVAPPVTYNFESQYNYQPNFYTENNTINVENLQNQIMAENLTTNIYKCDKCPKIFHSISHLQQHQTIHLKKFFCQVCGSSFTRKKELTRHEISVHNDAKIYQCTQCYAAFSRKDKLIRHERIHLRDKNNLNLIPNPIVLPVKQQIPQKIINIDDDDEDNQLKIVEENNVETKKVPPPLIPLMFEGKLEIDPTLLEDKSKNVINLNLSDTADKEWLKNYLKKDKTIIDNLSSAAVLDFPVTSKNPDMVNSEMHSNGHGHPSMIN